MLATEEDLATWRARFFAGVMPLWPVQGPRRHNLKELQLRAQAAEKYLDGIAQLRVQVHWPQPDEATRAQLWDQHLELLYELRDLDATLESDATLGLIARVSRMSPALAGRIQEKREAALETIRHFRAYLAYMFDETDDQDLGIQVMPSPPEDVPAGPSEDFSFS
jgi:hypothetical protein